MDKGHATVVPRSVRERPSQLGASKVQVREFLWSRVAVNGSWVAVVAVSGSWRQLGARKVRVSEPLHRERYYILY